MKTRTKEQIKLALWGGVAVAVLLSAIYVAFE
jgi:hypothetical protein